MEPYFSHPKPQPTNPKAFFDISFLEDLKLKILSTKKPWQYQLKCLFILGYWHIFIVLNNFKLLHLQENDSKHEVSKIWVARQILKKKHLVGASSIDTRPSGKMPSWWKVTQPLHKKQSCNFSKIVSILLSASVERFSVSCMRDF